jgi:hypothetical protein
MKTLNYYDNIVICATIQCSVDGFPSIVCNELIISCYFYFAELKCEDPY